MGLTQTKVLERKNISNANARQVWEKTKGICMHCQTRLQGEPDKRGHHWHVDHYLALNKGGKNSIENYVPSCSPCNLKKSDLSVEEFLTKQKLPRRCFYLDKQTNVFCTQFTSSVKEKMCPYHTWFGKIKSKLCCIYPPPSDIDALTTHMTNLSLQSKKAPTKSKLPKHKLNQITQKFIQYYKIHKDSLSDNQVLFIVYDHISDIIPFDLKHIQIGISLQDIRTKYPTQNIHYTNASSVDYHLSENTPFELKYDKPKTNCKN
jgi:hypothetical protein